LNKKEDKNKGKDDKIQKTLKTKTTSGRSPLMTLGQETKWAYSAKLEHHAGSDSNEFTLSKQRVCVS